MVDVVDIKVSLEAVDAVNAGAGLTKLNSAALLVVEAVGVVVRLELKVTVDADLMTRTCFDVPDVVVLMLATFTRVLFAGCDAVLVGTPGPGGTQDIIPFAPSAQLAGCGCLGLMTAAFDAYESPWSL